MTDLRPIATLRDGRRVELACPDALRAELQTSPLGGTLFHEAMRGMEEWVELAYGGYVRADWIVTVEILEVLLHPPHPPAARPKTDAVKK